jgi:GDPmannose 4,6-dehydratase
MVTGVSGQDGAYLAELLLGKGYRVVGTYRPGRSDHFWRLDRLGVRAGVELVELDLLDGEAVKALIDRIRPDEIYNLASFSSVLLSFNQPVSAAQSNIVTVLNVLDAVRTLGLDTRVFQASSSEMYGLTGGGIVDEESPFNPQSPYAIAKACAHRFARFYRECYNVHTNLGILFNHESPLRDPAYLSMKVAVGVAALRDPSAVPLVLGNLDIARDWGFARDYVEGMWACNQVDSGEAFVFSTGRGNTIRELVEAACRQIGFALEWHGEGLDTRGLDTKTGRCLVKVSKEFYRPYDGGRPIGNSAKAKRMLGWTPRVSFDELTGILMDEALNRSKKTIGA